VAKLWRDKILTKASKSILVYPKIGFEEKSFSLNIENSVFMFEVWVL